MSFLIPILVLFLLVFALLQMRGLRRKSAFGMFATALLVAVLGFGALGLLASAAMADEVVVLDSSGFILEDSGQAVACEAVHNKLAMSYSITDSTGNVLAFVKVPTGATERYVEDFKDRDPSLLNPSGAGGQSCADGCYATAHTIYTGQALACRTR